MSTVPSADTGSNVAMAAVIAAVIGTALLFLATVLTPAQPTLNHQPVHVAAVAHHSDKS